MTFIIIFIWTLTAFAQECRGQITVTQSPSMTAAQPGQTVNINCRTSSNVYYHSSYGHYLAWYLQKPGEAPKLLIYYANRLQSGTEDAGHYYCQSFHYPNSKMCYCTKRSAPSQRALLRLRTLLRL
ncbi:Immunoglobulin kappa variable 4-1 [Anabarilius grahami]|nr:Immunoglobulin kappa variable 4-1 [Anabarilius grahami]